MVAAIDRASEVVDQALPGVYELLKTFATREDFLDQVAIAFGNNFDPETLEALRQQWASGDFEDFPEIEVRTGAELNGANGAFAAATNTIYLSRDYLERNRANLPAVTNVLMEEYGHFVDAQINEVGANGDEKVIFSTQLLDETLNKAQIQKLQANNDMTSINQGLTTNLRVGDFQTFVDEFQLAKTTLGKNLVNELDLTKLLVYGTTISGRDPNTHIRPNAISSAPPPLSIPMIDYLTKGAGRYAKPSEAPLIKAFFSDAASTAPKLANGTYTIQSLSKALNLAPSPALLRCDVSQYTTDPSSSDFMERAYVFGSTPFEIANTATFTVNAGAYTVNNLEVRALPDNFDFQSINPLAIAANVFLEKAFDPYGLIPIVGSATVSVVINYTGSGRQYPSYSETDFNTDVAFVSNSQNAILAGEKFLKELAGLATNTGYLGAINSDRRFSYYTPDGKKIIYGTPDNDTLNPLSAEVTPAIYFGFQMVGGDGNDQITGGVFGDELWGGSGKDTLDGGSGNDILIGGQENDILDGGGGKDVAVFLNPFSNYYIVPSSDKKVFTVKPKLTTILDGEDTLRNIETIQFSNALVSLPDLTTQLLTNINSAGTFNTFLGTTAKVAGLFGSLTEGLGGYLSDAQGQLNSSTELADVPLLGNQLNGSSSSVSALAKTSAVASPLSSSANPALRFINNIADDFLAAIGNIEDINKLNNSDLLDAIKQALNLSSLTPAQTNQVETIGVVLKSTDFYTSLSDNLNAAFSSLSVAFNALKSKDLWAESVAGKTIPSELDSFNLGALPAETKGLVQELLKAITNELQVKGSNVSPQQFVTDVLNAALGYSGQNILKREISLSDFSLSNSPITTEQLNRLRITLDSLVNAVQTGTEILGTSNSGSTLSRSSDIILAALPAIEGTQGLAYEAMLEQVVTQSLNSRDLTDAETQKIGHSVLSSVIRNSVEGLVPNIDQLIDKIYLSIGSKLNSQLYGFVGKILDTPLGYVGNYLDQVLAGISSIQVEDFKELSRKFIVQLAAQPGQLNPTQISNALVAVITENYAASSLTATDTQVIVDRLNDPNFGLLDFNTLSNWITNELFDSLEDFLNGKIGALTNNVASIEVDPIQGEGIANLAGLSLDFALQGTKMLGEVPLDGSLNIAPALNLESDGTASLQFGYDIDFPQIDFTFDGGFKVSDSDNRLPISLSLLGSLNELDARAKLGPFLYTIQDVYSAPELNLNLQIPDLLHSPTLSVQGSANTQLRFETSKNYTGTVFDTIAQAIPDIGVDLVGQWNWATGSGAQLEKLELTQPTIHLGNTLSKFLEPVIDVVDPINSLIKKTFDDYLLKEIKLGPVEIKSDLLRKAIKILTGISLQEKFNFYLPNPSVLPIFPDDFRKILDTPTDYDPKNKTVNNPLKRNNPGGDGKYAGSVLDYLGALLVAGKNSGKLSNDEFNTYANQLDFLYQLKDVSDIVGSVIDSAEQGSDISLALPYSLKIYDANDQANSLLSLDSLADSTALESREDSYINLDLTSIDTPEEVAAFIKSFDNANTDNANYLVNKDLVSALATPRTSGLSFPLISDPNQIYNLLFGNFSNVDLVEYTFPPIKLLDIKIPGPKEFISIPIWIFNIDIQPQIGFLLNNLTIGYDASGLQNYANSLETSKYGDIAKLLLGDGFYFDDKLNGVDVPEFKFLLGLNGGASIGRKYAQVGTGLNAAVEFALNLNDYLNDPVGDGKVRFSDLLTLGKDDLAFLAGNPFAITKQEIFDVSLAGQLGLYLYGKLGPLKGKLDFGPWELFNVALTPPRGPSNEPPPQPPVLAKVSSGEPKILQLSIGANSTEWTEFRAQQNLPPLTDEVFTINFKVNSEGIAVPDTLVVEGYGYSQEYPVNFSRIEADTGEGDDQIQVDPLISIPVKLKGGLGNDQLRGGAANDNLTGNEGEDLLLGNAGGDFLDGGNDDDVLLGDTGDDAAAGGNDTLFGGNGDDQLLGESGDDLLQGESGDDDLVGGDGNDGLMGGDGDDDLLGGIGNDSLEGNAGNDMLLGEAGNDLLQGGEGNDNIGGGEGTDTISYVDSNNGVIVNIDESQSYANSGDSNDLEGNFSIGAVTALDGFGFTDHFKFTRVISEYDDDINAEVEAAIAALQAEVEGKELTPEEQKALQQKIDAILKDATGQKIEVSGNLEIILGSQHDDVLIGNSQPNTIQANAGNDLVISTPGDDDLDGGEGIDTISYRRDPKAVTVNLTTQLATDGFGNTDQVKNFENVVGSGYADTIIGDDQVNTITAGSGADTIEGNAGNDKLYGGEGNDSLYGNEGDDYLAGEVGDDYLYGHEGNDQLDGGIGNDFLSGGTGEDLLHGQAGEDVIFGDEGNDWIAGDEGDDRLFGGLGNFDDIFGGAGNDIIIDEDGINSIHGNEGNDTINITFASGWISSNGQHRPDGAITGGYGDDNITVTMNHPDFFINLKGDESASSTPEDGNDTVTLEGTYANSVVDLGGGDDTFYGGIGNDNVTGGNGNDRLNSGDGDDQLFGGNGDDTLDGGWGFDTLDGGDGVDTATYAFYSGGIIADLNTGIVSFPGNSTFVDRLISIENVVGSQGQDRITGNSANNILDGGNGNDSLYGNAGDDILIGGAGDGWPSDILDGGEGNDTASYITAQSRVAVSLLQKSGWEGDARGDQLISIENLEGSQFNDFLVGDNGNNILKGLSGNDELDGGLGHDTLIGGEGNDILYGNEGDDTLDGGSGDDTVRGGRGNDLLKGSEGNDILEGNEGNDSLDGGEGNNRLDAGEGNNTITAANGQNTVYGGSGNDVVTIGDGDNDIRVGEGNNTITVGNGNNQIYTGAGADTITAGNGNNKIFAAEGNNIITTGSGDDLIYAGAGNDVISSGAGNDTIYAAEGVNTIISGDGDDIIHSGSGADSIAAGTGSNILWLGGGRDTIALEFGGSTTIHNFSISQTKISLGSVNIQGIALAQIGNDALVVMPHLAVLATLKDTNFKSVVENSINIFGSHLPVYTA